MSKTAPYKCGCGDSLANYKATLQHIKDKHQNNNKPFGVYKRVGNLTSQDANDILSEKDMQ